MDFGDLNTMVRVSLKGGVEYFGRLDGDKIYDAVTIKEGVGKGLFARWARAKITGDVRTFTLSGNGMGMIVEELTERQLVEFNEVIDKVKLIERDAMAKLVADYIKGEIF